MRRGQAYALLSLSTLALVLAGARVGWSTARSYAPEQPIAFHHRDHVETDRLDCEICHSGVRRSAFAGIPPVERCMGCHQVVVPQHPEVARLRRYYDAGQ